MGEHQPGVCSPGNGIDLDIPNLEGGRPPGECIGPGKDPPALILCGPQSCHRLTLGTALFRMIPLFLVRGCWERNRWSMSKGMLGKPSPSSRYRFCGVGGTGVNSLHC